MSQEHVIDSTYLNFNILKLMLKINAKRNFINKNAYLVVIVFKCLVCYGKYNIDKNGLFLNYMNIITIIFCFSKACKGNTIHRFVFYRKNALIFNVVLFDFLRC